MEEAWKRSLRVVLQTLESFHPEPAYASLFIDLSSEMKMTVNKLIHDRVVEENKYWSDVKLSLWRVAHHCNHWTAYMPHLLSMLSSCILLHLTMWDSMCTWQDRTEHIVSLLQEIGQHFRELNPLEYGSFLGPDSPALMHRIGRALRKAGTHMEDIDEPENDS